MKGNREMIRNLKFVMLGLVAVLAFNAMTASGAMALQKFHSEGSPTKLTGSQEGQDVFKTDGGTVECTTATYVGEQTGTEVTEVEVAPTYSGCTAFGGFAGAEILMNGCKYRFTITGEDASHHATGTADIICSGTNEITVIAKSFGTTKCTAHIHAQNGLGTVTYTNVGTGATREVTVDVSITGITYNQTAGTGFGACSSTETTNGTYTGHALVTGEHTVGGVTTHTGIFTA
jgi:hypothetical protein